MLATLSLLSNLFVSKIFILLWNWAMNPGPVVTGTTVRTSVYMRIIEIIKWVPGKRGEFVSSWSIFQHHFVILATLCFALLVSALWICGQESCVQSCAASPCCYHGGSPLELQTNLREIWSPNRTFSWLKAAITAFTFKNLIKRLC